MKLHDLKPAAGSTRKKSRVGRGIAAGKGKTAGRGTKGQGARGRRGKRAYFEGGQLPLVRRLPFKRGFTNIFRIDYQEVNVEAINERFEDGATVTPESLAAVGLVRKSEEPVVILGNGDIDKKLTVQAHRFTKSAIDKIEKAGGSTEKLELLLTGAHATVKKLRKEDLAKLQDQG
ncbi:MAG: 50S ribosomal protein L15 [Anaerolineaceae bacterium]|nr:50S ribosomal protein L15 [Anaerolineaceae bacterium]